MGIPKFGAATLATSSGTNALPSGVRGNYSRGSFNRNNSTKKYASKKPSYSSGGRVKTTAGSSSRSSRSRGSSRAKAIEIEDFAMKAEKSAMNNMISKDTSRPIFDIITYRYKASAWREFKEQIDKELKEDTKE